MKKLLCIILTFMMLMPAFSVAYAENEQLLTEPFLQLPGETSVNVVWFTEYESIYNKVFIYGNGSENESTASFTANTTKMSRMRNLTSTEKRDIYRHEATVTGLPKYFSDKDKVEYKVVSDTAESRIYKLQAMPQKGVDMKILLTSDSQLKEMSPANMQKVVEKFGEGEIDAVFFAGDLVNVPDAANEWFDDAGGGSFFPSMQGTANKAYPNATYKGGAIIQYAPMYTAIGNHEVMGRYSESTTPKFEFEDPAPRSYAEALFKEKYADYKEGALTATGKEQFILDNSFNTISYEEMFTLPPSKEGGERYYAETVGDIRLITLEVTRIWRNNSVGRASKYSEIPGELGETNPNRKWGSHIYESIAEGSEQYEWLKKELASDEFKNAKYKIVMFHHQFHSLGGNVVPAFTDPVEDTVTVNVDGEEKEMIIYKYPLEKDQMVGIEPLLEGAGVDLIFNGHSHIWNRFVTKKGVNVLETSNVGNTYQIFYDEKERTSSVPSAFNESNAYHSIANEWDKSDYVLQGDPYGLTPQMPAIAPLNGKPYIESNTVTAFSVFDTGTGIIDSYYYDTDNPGSDIVHFDSFSIFNQNKAQFEDVKKTDWFYDSVSYVTKNNIFKGVSETQFAPDEQLTRAMVVTLLSRIDGSTEGILPAFDDVKETDWFARPVGWAQKNGIVNGVTDTSFAPDRPITREDLTVILHRYAKLKEYPLTSSESLDSFSDKNKISDYATEPVKWAVSSGIMGGKGNGIIDPAAFVTRAEAATILMRFCNKYQ